MAQSLTTERHADLDPIMSEMLTYGSEFAKTYANHAPMVLVALERIGGSTDRLHDFFDHYRDYKKLLPFGSIGEPVTAANWETAIGERSREPDLRIFFTSEIAAHGVEKTLNTYLPRLAPGVGASAFHALMRLAYALIREDDTDVAVALAYWTATYLEMPPATGAAPITDDPAEVLARVSDIRALHGQPILELLWQNMDQAGRTPDFVPVVDWLEIGPDTTRKMALASIALFAATQEFAALHAVTGMHWLRIVLPYCPTPDAMLRHFWQCIASLLGEMRFPALPDAETLERWRQLPVPSWEAIKAAAAKSYDEHDISIAFSASEEMKVYGDPLYQLAAARRVGLIPDYT